MSLSPKRYAIFYEAFDGQCQMMTIPAFDPDGALHRFKMRAGWKGVRVITLHERSIEDAICDDCGRSFKTFTGRTICTNCSRRGIR